MNIPVNDIDKLERLLFEVMVAFAVRKPDGLDVIWSTLVAIEEVGIEMDVLKASDKGRTTLR